MSLKIMLHGRLQAPAAVAGKNGSLASSSTVSQQVRRASFGQQGHAGVGVLHLPAPVRRRRGTWLVPGENLAERRAYVLQLGLRQAVLRVRGSVAPTRPAPCRPAPDHRGAVHGFRSRGTTEREVVPATRPITSADVQDGLAVDSADL